MKAGRKRLFDVNETLGKAMMIFWENGFSGTSLTDLTTGLGINKPSLYAAFGNKEQLYTAALKYYLNNFSSPRYENLIEPKKDDLKIRLRNSLTTLAHTVRIQILLKAAYLLIVRVNRVAKVCLKI